MFINIVGNKRGVKNAPSVYVNNLLVCRHLFLALNVVFQLTCIKQTVTNCVISPSNTNEQPILSGHCLHTGLTTHWSFTMHLTDNACLITDGIVVA